MNEQIANSNTTLHNTDFSEHMSFIFLDTLRKTNPAWRLLASPQAPFAVSFFYQEFVAGNRRQIAEQELISRLENFIYTLNQGRDEPLFPRTSREYLNEWADDQHGWLRKFYPSGQDEPHFDITSLAQKSIEWLLSLKQQTFIGTESRLLTVFELFRQIIVGAETDPTQRLAELERQKKELEQEIKRVSNGEISLLDETQIRERFLQAMSTAREILSDFRAVEHNFRELDRDMRESIAVWDKGKGELLEKIFTDQDGISQSEQGKSFAAFWSFLMSASSQEDFSETMERVLALKPVSEMRLGWNSRNIHHDWVEAGAHVQETVAALSQQLRHYVDENFIEEERRINQILREIEGKALAVRNNPPKEIEWSLRIDAIKPEIRLPFDRPLFTPRERPEITDDVIIAGMEDFPADSLFSQIYVDKAKIKDQITYLLRTQDSLTLSQIIDQYPLEYGLNELVIYLVIASESTETVFSTDDSEEVFWEEDGLIRKAIVPKVTFKQPQLV